MPSPAGPLRTLRIWSVLLILFVGLASLNAGIFVAQRRADGSAIWPLLAVLVAVVAGVLAWMFGRVIAPLERDLARQQLTEDEVRRRADQFEDLYNHAPCGYHSLDAQGCYIHINDTALSWLGYTREEMLGRHVLEFVTPTSREFFRTSFPEYKKRGWVRDAEYQFVRKDGTVLHVLLCSVAQRDESGRFVLSRSTFIDLTERKRYEERLGDLSVRLQAVMDAATSVAVIATDLDGRISLFNAGAERMLGYRAGEMLGRESPWSIHLASEVMAHGERLSREFDRPVRGFDVLVERARLGEFDERQWTYVRKDGSHLTVHQVVTGLRSAEGKLNGFLCVATDISERIATARALRMTMESARIGTWDWDLDTDHIIWSDNVPMILGLSGPPAELTFARFLDAILPEDRVRVRASLDAVLAGGGDIYDSEFRTRGFDGQICWLEDKGRVFRDTAGTARRMMGTVLDVTDRKRAAEALRQARDAAESANRAKSEFLASMSHEIRTPLGAIVGLVELLQQGTVADAQRDQLSTMATAAETLLSLINDVLDISKIEAGKLELEAIPFDLRDLVNGVADVLSPAARQKGLNVTVSVADAIPARLIGDPGRLRQVLMNLVGNAVKFTAAGEVRISIAQSEARSASEAARFAPLTPNPSPPSTGARGDSGPLQFQVRDTGVGIPADKLRTIFQPFTQAHTSTSRTYGGTGLGLTISSALVERMGGKIHVDSTPGQGSTFSFALALPVAEGSQAEPPAQETPVISVTGPALRVLLTEDNPVNQQVLTLMLERAGHHVSLANNGREALTALERERFDLILMDVQMPEMDGLRCTKLIRQREKSTGRRIPIVAVTANAMSGERQRCLHAGMDDYLAKPVRGHELAAVISKLLGHSVGLASAPTEPAPAEVPAWLASLREMGFDEDGILRLTRTFLDSVPARLEALRRAVAARDTHQVYLAAHTLKGSLGVFAADSALAASVSLMALAQEQQRDGFAAALADLETEVAPLLESMHRVMASA